eukprot:1499740-Amphidinium_carterae.1
MRREGTTTSLTTLTKSGANTVSADVAARTDTARKRKLTNRARQWCSWTNPNLHTIIGDTKWGYPELEYASNATKLQRLEWDGRKTAFGTARHVSHDQVMPRGTVPDEDTDTSSDCAMAIQARIVVERPIPD